MFGKMPHLSSLPWSKHDKWAIMGYGHPSHAMGIQNGYGKLAMD